MRRAALIICGVLFAVLSPHGVAQDRNEIVDLHTLTFPGRLYEPFMPPPEAGTPATILGIMRVPPGTGRIPAVILMHGCSGVTGAETYWARNLLRLGVMTFVVNSFSGRDIPETCTGRHHINMASVMTDAHRALAFVAAHARADSARIALMGFSFGGRTALWTSHPRFQERYGAGPLRFAAHLAFYPAACYIRLADEDRMGAAPIRIFHGVEDDATPVAPCRDYVARLRRAGKDVALREYPGARHSFDNPALPSRQDIGIQHPSLCSFVERDGQLVDVETGRAAGIDLPCIGRVATVGYNAAAQQQATADVEAFLTAVFRLN